MVDVSFQLPTRPDKCKTSKEDENTLQPLSYETESLFRVNGPGTPHPPPGGGFEPYIILKYYILAIQNRLAIQKKRWFHRVIAL